MHIVRSLPAITRTFDFTFRSIWVAKWHHFLSRSLWRYLLVALLITGSWGMLKNYPVTSRETLHTLGYLMVGAVVFGVLVNLFAAMLQAKQLKNRKVKATFSNLKVQLVFLESDKEVKEEVYTWSDVKKVADTAQYLLLAFKKRPRFLLCIAKQKLALDEIKWLQELTG